MTRRLFVGVGLPSEAAAIVDAWRANLELPGRPVPAENFHITLRFIGDVDGVGSDKILAALDDLETEGPRRLALDSLGTFPRASKAVVAWLGVRHDGWLDRLADDVNDAVDHAGFGVEERPFRAHVTLSRIRPAVDLRSYAAEPLDLPVEIERFTLFESHLGGGPVRYEAIEHVTL